jgi:hypothetical protein
MVPAQFGRVGPSNWPVLDEQGQSESRHEREVRRLRAQLETFRDLDAEALVEEVLEAATQQEEDSRRRIHVRSARRGGKECAPGGVRAFP